MEWEYIVSSSSVRLIEEIIAPASFANFSRRPDAADFTPFSDDVINTKSWTEWNGKLKLFQQIPNVRK